MGRPSPTIEDIHKLAKKRGLKCISNKYQGCNKKLKWMCKNKHIFLSSYRYLKHRKHCPYCWRISIEDAQKLAKKRGFVCVSKRIINNSIPIKWKCKNGHDWKANYNNIRIGRGCPHCLKSTLEARQKEAEKRGLVILSKKYINYITPLKYRCKNGHIFKTTPNIIQRRGGGCGCKICNDNGRRYGFDFVKKDAIKHGFKCISKKTEYINANSSLRYVCKKGHNFRGRPSRIQEGSGCRQCAYDSYRLNIEYIKKDAKKRGLLCLSKKYINNKKPLKYRCLAKGHVWWTKYDSIKQRGRCPYCRTYVREDICRQYFRHYTGCLFYKSYPNWLRNGKGYRLELDGYSKKLFVAFEHQGEQHYGKSFRFDKRHTFSKIRKHDLLKKKLCKKHHVKLFLIPYTIHIENLGIYIYKKLKRNGIKIKNKKQIIIH